MPYDHGAHTFEAARLLEELKRKANPSASATLRSTSSLADATFRHLSMEKAAGVHVYQGDRGGWFADLTFHDMPPGMSDCIGTPVNQPHRTREEAMKSALNLVQTIMSNDLALAESETGPQLPQDTAAFLFHGLTIPIPLGMLEVFKAAMQDEPDEDYVLGRLAEIEANLESIEDLTPEMIGPTVLRELIPVAVLALNAGVLRWPPLEEASPNPMN